MSRDDSLESTLKDFLTYLPTGVVLIERRSCTIALINKIACDIFEVTAEWVTGRECRGFVCGEWDGNCPFTSSGKEHVQKEILVRRKSDALIPVLRSARHLTIGDTEYIIESIIDISKQKLSEQELDKRYRILKGLAQAVNTLLSSGESFDTATEESLAVLGEAFESDGAFLYQIQPTFDSIDPGISLRYSWYKDETKKMDMNIESIIETRKNSLERGECIMLHAEELRFTPSGSLICVPIFKQHRLWGTLCLAWENSTEDWSEAVTTTFLTAADSFGGALNIQESRMQLKQEKQRAEELAIRANESNRSKSRFLANMSHEIRTPLNGILGFLSLLSTTSLSDEQQEYLKDAETSANSLLYLINDILDFSKIEAGKIDIELKEFNFHTMVDETVSILSPVAVGNNNELTILLGEGVPETVIGDRGRFRQILLNLGGNAAKFTKNGRVNIIVKREREENRKLHLSTHIIDDGIGIDLKLQKQLFTPFFQGQASANREFGGTGLGLVISQKLVELMGGEIGFTSEPGMGSHFWFTIPFRPSRNPAPSSYDRKALQGNTVAIVSTYRDVRDVTATYIEEWGASAIKMAEWESQRRENIDITIIDEVCLRDGNTSRLPQNQHTIVLASPMQKVSSHRKNLPAGAVTLTKPIRKRKLYQSLLTILRPQHQNTETAVQEADTCTAAPERPRETAHILIAEDNKINQKLAVRILKNSGYTSDVVSNGREAIEAFKANRYDAILMDCQMPDIDGYLAALRIRQIEKRRQTENRIPIIALTAHAMKGEREKVKSAGMDDYLSKPVEPKKLISYIEKWLQKTVLR